MKTLTFQNALNQKTLLSHLMIVLISLIFVGIYSIGNQNFVFPVDQINMFLLLLIQIELFILLGNWFFTGMKNATTRKELTRIVLSRFLVFFIFCFVVAFLIIISFTWFSNKIIGNNSADALAGFLKYGFKGWFKGTIAGLLFGAAIFIFLQWQEALAREQKLREQNLIFQNETLKNQVNPHFLFNSLNTLSSLVHGQPELAEKFISKLSSIYRYILENNSKDKVLLEEELSFIDDYFYLHKIRDEGKIELEIKIDKTASMMVLPISLQGLVENAIKHNKATREAPLKIVIFLENGNIVVKNNLQKLATQLKSTRIGLKNLAERIKLVSGKELVVEETQNSFIVKLPLLS